MVKVKVQPKNYIEWAVLGFYISKTLSTHYWDVPVMTGINPIAVSSDDIMSFCASMNNPGSITHFLIEGLSPEGRTLKQALAGKKPKEEFSVGPKEMKEIYDTMAADRQQTGYRDPTFSPNRAASVRRGSFGRGEKGPPRRVVRGGSYARCQDGGGKIRSEEDLGDGRCLCGPDTGTT